MRFPRAIANLIEALTELPSVGPKTAERYAFYLLKSAPEKLNKLTQALLLLKTDTLICSSCYAFSESELCPICADKNRRNGLLCIVENTQDLLSLEATKQYGGQYFVLGGLINTIEDVRPEHLNIEKLLKRIKTGEITEIIIALNFTIEGETTTLYLKKILEKYPIKISRLAKGLPAGSDLEYADEMTLATALNYRHEMK
jgi:recombination protein RecR